MKSLYTPVSLSEVAPKVDYAPCGLCGKHGLRHCLEGDLSYPDGSYRACPNWAVKLAECSAIGASPAIGPSHRLADPNPSHPMDSPRREK